MHEGYFVGRKELIGWIQQHFQPSFQKIEDLGSGVVYCQIIDSIYPECKVMAKVKRDAKIEVDYINNFKQLQKAFSQKKIDRFIEIDKLSKKSFQTNMEFVQARPPSTASDASDPRLHAGPAAPPWAPRDCTLALRRCCGRDIAQHGAIAQHAQHGITAQHGVTAHGALRRAALHACLSPRSPRRSHLAHHGARLRVRVPLSL
jgi:RP/EB family microtubule-associated protein